MKNGYLSNQEIVERLTEAVPAISWRVSKGLTISHTEGSLARGRHTLFFWPKVHSPIGAESAHYSCSVGRDRDALHDGRILTQTNITHQFPTPEAAVLECLSKLSYVGRDKAELWGSFAEMAEDASKGSTDT